MTSGNVLVLWQTRTALLGKTTEHLETFKVRSTCFDLASVELHGAVTVFAISSFANFMQWCMEHR